MEHFFFSSWSAVLRTVVIGILAYVGLVVLLRVSGRRTLSKMNAFDLVVTVALGSTLATVLLNKNVTLVQGLLGFALLIGMQFVVTWASVHARWVRRIVTGEPALLLYQGQFLQTAMRKVRVTKDEVRAAVRGAGRNAIDDIDAVVLETDGSFSVIRRGEKTTEESSIAGVKKPGPGSTDGQ